MIRLPFHSARNLLLLPLAAGLLAASAQTKAAGNPAANASLLSGTTAKRGTVVDAKSIAKLSKHDIDGSVSPAEAPLVTNDPTRKSAAGNAKCDVNVVQLTYGTINPQDAPKAVYSTGVATTVLLVPGTGCTAPWPMLSQQHGTSIGYQAVGKEGVFSAAAYYGSQGYVVVMPDYQGYSGSSLDYHPYLQAEPSGAVVIDAVRAARNWLHQNGFGASLSPKLFLAGTSQGGYVTMAAQRSMERYFPDEFAITASSPTSGPYQLQATLDQFMSAPDQADESKTVGATLVIEGFQQRYHDIYNISLEAYNAPWASEMGATPPLLPSPTYSDFGPLFQKCILPYNLKDAGGPTFGDCKNTPLLQDSFVKSYLSSIPGNGAVQMAGGGAQVRAHAGENNLLQNWKPASKTFVCYGDLDFMATPNALAAQQYFQAAGSGALMTVENLQTDTNPVIVQWLATEIPKHPPGMGYHGQVEAPACTSWSRHAVFDPLR